MKIFETNDYLLVRRSLYASDFRERAPRAQFSGLCSGDILTIKENTEKLVDGYLLIVLNSPRLWKFVVANGSGSITRRVKWNDLSKFKVAIPDRSLQEKVVRSFKHLQAALDQIEKQKLTIKNLRQRLLNEILG